MPLPHISLGMNFQFHGPRRRGIDPRAGPQILLLCIISFWPCFCRFSLLRLTLRRVRGLSLVTFFHACVCVCVGSRSYRPPPLDQKNSSDNKEPPVEPHDTTGVKDPQSFFFFFPSSFHTLSTTPFSTSHKLLISALSSISVGDKSPVSCTWAPAPDRVSASTLRLFIIPPQGILLTPRLPI